MSQQNNHETAIVATPVEPESTSLTYLEGAPTILAIAEAAESMVAALQTIKRAALTVTNGLDWIKFQGRNYLQDTGTDKVARLFRVTTEPVGTPPWSYEEWEDDQGKYYEYTYTVKASLPGGADSVTEVGTCSSRDKFFGTETVDGETVFKEMSEVHRSNVKKKAYTNAKQRAIKSLLGLDSVTDEDISEHVGDLTSVQFGSAKAKRKDDPKKEEQKEAHITKIKKMLEAMYEAADIPQRLSEYSQYKKSAGAKSYEELRKMSPGRVFFTWQAINEEHERFREGVAAMEKEGSQ